VSETSDPFGQGKYQVRFDWGVEGAQRIAPGAHVVVLVDALGRSTAAVLAAERGDALPLDGRAVSAFAEPGPGGAVVLAASLRNRSAVAERILALQEERGERTIVAVVALGDSGSSADGGGGIRFGIADQLTAGAVVDALIGLGIDHTSPEAAVACAAYEGLTNAVVHLIGASGRGAELTAAGRRAEVRLATERDVARVVPELRDGAFQP